MTNDTEAPTRTRFLSLCVPPVNLQSRTAHHWIALGGEERTPTNFVAALWDGTKRVWRLDRWERDPTHQDVAHWIYHDIVQFTSKPIKARKKASTPYD